MSTAFSSFSSYTEAKNTKEVGAVMKLLERHRRARPVGGCKARMYVLPVSEDDSNGEVKFWCP
jgi:hypothetical protein